MASTDTTVKIKVNTDIKEPSLFKVIYLNDDVTTMEFVVDSLMEHFKYNAETAIQLTETINSTGSSVVAVLPFELAEQKGTEVTLEARANGFPLAIKIESEA